MKLSGVKLSGFEDALIVIGFPILLFCVPHELFLDGETRFNFLDNLLTRGALSPARYSLVGPLVASPLWALGHVLVSPSWWCARFNTLCFLCFVLALGALIRRRAGAELARKLVLVLIAASMFPNHTRGFFGEVFTVSAVGLGLALTTLEGRGAGWVLTMLGVANAPASLVGLAAVSTRETVARKRLRYLAPVLGAAGLIALEAWLRRGSPWRTGYEGDRGPHTLMPYSGRPGFSYPFALGLLSIVSSPGKGLIFFAPGLALSATSALRRDARGLFACQGAWLAFLVGLVLVYSKWWAWYGGWFWGPRFFLFASLPASLALAYHLERPPESLAGKVGVLVALALSGWVAASGAVFDLRGLEWGAEHNYASECLIWHIPEFSVLWHPLIEPPSLSVTDGIALEYFALAQVVLALPIAVSVARAVLSSMARAASRLGSLREWRF
jgi:hypothetical protein